MALSRPKTYVIVAPYFKMAENYFRVHGISRKHWKYIATDGQLYGLHRDTEILWLTHDDRGEIHYPQNVTSERIIERMKELFHNGYISVRVIGFEEAP